MSDHRRFFVEFPLQEKEPVLLKERKFIHQLKNVLRLKRGDRIILLDGKGNEYETEILRVFDNQISGLVRKKIERPPGPTSEIKINLYQSLIRDKRLKLVFEKGTELGVSSFIPLQTFYSLKKNLNYERIKRVTREAAEQSRRKEAPVIMGVLSFEKAVDEVAKEKGLHFIFHEKGERFSLKTLEEAEKFDNINIFIGPEGGFSDKEIERAKNSNFRVVKIEDLILRSETAAIVALGIVQAVLPR